MQSLAGKSFFSNGYTRCKGEHTSFSAHNVIKFYCKKDCFDRSTINTWGEESLVMRRQCNQGFSGIQARNEKV